MKNFSKKFISFLLAFILILSPISSSLATGQGLDIKTIDKEVSEKEALSVIEAYKDRLNTSNKLGNYSDDAEKEVRVIVEVDGDPTIDLATAKGVKVSELAKSELARKESSLLDSQKSVQQAMSNKGIKAEVLSSMTTVVNAFAAKVKLADVEKIEKLSGVNEVAISNEYERPEMITSTEQVSAQLAWDLGFTGEGTVLAVLDSGIDPSHKDFVISEGVDVTYTEDSVNEVITRESLPGKYYNAKVPYAYNYYDLNDVVKDIGSSQHGQHVAGTMAANGDLASGGIKGVAPDAQLLGMKVFSSDIRYATTFTDIYVKAIDDAIKLGADAINMSLGAPAGFYVENGLEQRLLEKAQDNGIVSTISAGNERNIVNGWYFGALEQNPDTGVTGSPSSNRAAFTIASFENTALMSAVANITPDDTGLQIPLTEAGGSPEFATIANSEGYEFEFVGTGKAAEFEGVDVQGKVAIAVRGNTFTDTIANGMNAGAAAVIVYNHEDGGEGIVNMAGGDIATIPFAFITHSKGLALVEAKKANPDTRLIFKASKESVPNPSANTMSTFSSWGPTPDLQLKAELTAPGGNIYSTQNDDKYTTMSGTSMAAPHAAGGVGVVREFVEKSISSGFFPAMNARELSDFTQLLLMNTADVKAEPGGSIYPVRQQGAGLMNLGKATTNFVTVTDADASHTSFGEGKVELGEVGDSATITLKAKNYGTDDITLDTKATVITEVADGGLLQEYTETVSEVTLDTVSVNARGEATLKLTLDLSSIPHNRFAEGHVVLTKDNGQTLSVPFLGFKGSWDEPRVIDSMDASLLLDDPGAADESVWLDEPLQPSQFYSSGFYHSGQLSGYLDDPDKLILAPDNFVYNMFLGVGQVIPVLSQLRNAATMEYQILDKDGNVLTTLGREDSVRKIYRLDQGNQPFRFAMSGLWDGTVNGSTVADGSYTYRIKSSIDFDGATPQTDDFRAVVDNTKPVFEKAEDGSIAYTFDKDKKVITFRAHDLIGEGLTADDVAGLMAATIYNESTDKSELLSVGDYTLVDDLKDLYEFTIDLTPYLVEGSNEVEISLMDKVFNSSRERIVLGGEDVGVATDKPLNMYLLNPELLEIYGDENGDGSSTGADVKVSGYLWGWDSLDKLTFAGQEIEFTKEDEITVADQGYQGPGFKFDTTMFFPEGYHEAKLEASAEFHENFSIARRFWVDVTRPVGLGENTFYTDADSADVSFDVYDNLHYIEVRRDGSLVDQIDASEEGGFAADATLTISETLSGLQDGINKFTYELADYLYTNTHDIYVVKGDLNIDELLQAIEDGESITGTYYQPSLDALAQAIEEGKALLEGNPTQEEVDAAAAKIREAIAALTAPASEELKNNLQELIDQTEALDSNLYTDESNAKLAEAIAKAKEVLANPEATDLDVYNATIDLQEALDSMEYRMIAPTIEGKDVTIKQGDSIDLASLFTAKDKFGNELVVTVEGEVDTNTPGVYTVTGTATADGLESSATATVTVEEVVVTEEIEDIIPRIYGKDREITVGTLIDLKELFSATTAEGNVLEVVVTGAFDKDSVGTYEITGKASYKGATASAKAIVTVVENDKTGLEAAVELAEKLIPGNYTEESVAIVEKAIANAKEVLADPNATKVEIAEATIALQTSTRGLTEKEEPVEPEELTMYARTNMFIRPSKGSTESFGILTTNTKVVGYRDGAWFKFTYNGKTAYVAYSLLVPEPVENVQVTRYAKTNIFIRPSKGSTQSLGILTTNTKIVGYEDGAWFRFTYKGKTAYVAKSLLVEKPVNVQVSKTTTSSIYVRPYKNATTSLGILRANTTIKGYVEGSWFKFTYNGKTAYVATAYLR